MNSVTVRPACADDLNLVKATYLENFKHSSSQGRLVRPQVYFQYQRQVMDRLLSKGLVRVACPTDTPEVIVGYLISEGKNVLHYLYVKQAFRRFGVARTLLEGFDLGTCAFTHFTDDCHWIVKKIPGLTYVPYLAQGAV